MKRAYLRKEGKSPTAQCKKRIQSLLREIAIIRDKHCFLSNYPESGKCGGYRNDGELILQYDHLNTRTANSSYGDSRFGVLVCKKHHIYWKPQFPFEYEKCAIDFIGPKRAELLYKVRADKRSYPMGIYEWSKCELGLIQELKDIMRKKLI